MAERDDEKTEPEAKAVDPFELSGDTVEPEPEPAPERETEAEEPEPEPAPEREVEAEAESRSDDEADDEKPDPERKETEHERGLRKALERERKANREWEDRMRIMEQQVMQLRTQPVQPPQAPEQSQPKADAGRFEVEFDPETGRAYVPQSVIDERVRQLSQPDPATVEQQRRAQAYQQLRSDFIGLDPKRADLMGRAEQAHDMTEKLAVSAAMRTGRDLRGLREPDSIVQFIRESGALDEASEQFPDIGRERLEKMMFASAVGSPYLMRDVLEDYARQATQPAQEAEPAPVVDVPADKPRSMAQRGGSEKKGGSSKQARFAELDKQFTRDPLSLNEKEYAEYETLLREMESHAA